MVTFSIITPVYNGEKFIEETIQSVLKAIEGLSHEYLVIDDGSTDTTPAILSKYKNQVIYIHQKNSGQSTAITKAIGLAKGKYSIIVNADDPLITNELFLEAEMILESKPNIVATYPDWQIVNEAGNILEVVRVKEFSINELVGRFNCLIGPGGIFRTDAAKKIGGWDNSYRYVPDYNFWLHMSDFGDFQHIPRIQAVWRTHGDSISISSRGIDMAGERVRVISEYLSRHPAVPENLKKMSIANAQYRAAVLSYFDKKIHGRKLIWSSIKIYPQIIFEKDKRVLAYLIFLPISRYAIQVLKRVLPMRYLESSLRHSIKS